VSSLESVQGRIIHEAGEAEASGPGPRTAQYNENLQSRTTLGPEISRENLRSSKIFASGGPGPWGGPQSLSCLRARRDHDPALSRFSGSSFHTGAVSASPARCGTYCSGSQAARPCDSGCPKSCTGRQSQRGSSTNCVC